MRSTGLQALAVTLLLGLSLSAAAYQKASIAQAHPGPVSSMPLARTQPPNGSPTAPPSATPTIPPLPTSTSSVWASATTVMVGETLTVHANSNLGIPLYTLRVYDASTGQEQSQTSPILTPARPDAINANYGPVSWSLTAVRTGTVYFTIGVSGESCYQNFCNWGYSSALSGSVEVLPAPTLDPSITPTLTPTPTSTATPTATPTPACAVRYAVNQWNTGFTADVTITNTSAAPMDSWSLAWSFPGDQQIANAWNTTLTQTGASVVARNAAWNGTVAPGGSASFGFQASYSGTNLRPSSFTLNGAACTILP